MKTKLTRIGDDIALVLDQTLLEQLGIDENSEVELETSGEVLVITPVRATEREKQFRDAMEKIDRQYEGVFRRLADS